jgi:hypothetical protein
MTLLPPSDPQTYAFRFRVNRSPGHTLNTEATRIDYPVEQPGISLSLRASSADLKETINKAARWVLIGEGYRSESEARTAATQFQDSFMLALAKVRLGVDAGERGGKFFLTEYGEQFYTAQYGRRVLNDVHGLTAYSLIPQPAFLTHDVNTLIGKPIADFDQSFSALIARPPQLGSRERLALSLFHASFFQPTADTRFLLLVMTIEALIVPQEKSPAAVAHIDAFMATIKDSSLPDVEKTSLLGSMRHVRNQSISQAGQQLVTTLLGRKTYQGKVPHKFFSQVYGLRSDLVHGNSAPPTFEEIANIVSDLEFFVSDLLTARL